MSTCSRFIQSTENDACRECGRTRAAHEPTENAEAAAMSEPVVVYQKPLPYQSIYRHLAMMANYLMAASENDKVKERREAKLLVAKKLDELIRGRAVKKLLDYGE